jgi:protein-tyrosine phosphatase
MTKKTNVLFVCLGNICRSPTAHGVFQALVDTENLNEHIRVDSAGTGDWHLGHAPDKRTSAVASERGYDLSDLRARLVEPADFNDFDYIIAMDHENMRNLQAMEPDGYRGELCLLLDHSVSPDFDQYEEVPDPYYGGGDGFGLVLDLVEDACAGLLTHIRSKA